MGNRLGQVAGLLLLGMAVARLGRLFVSGDNVYPWAPVLVVAVVLGILVRWLLGNTRIPGELAGVIMVVGAVVVFLRVTAADTLDTWVIPTDETWPVVAEQLRIGFGIFRSGVPPVTPTPGLVGVLAALFWLLGAIYVVGSANRQVSLMVLPTGVLYLQLAVLDRVPAGIAWFSATAGVVGLAIASMALDRHDRLGQVRGPSGRPRPTRSAAAAAAMAGCVAVVAVLGTARAAPLVSEYGNLPWQGRSWESGLGEGIAFDRFIELRQRLQSRQNAVVFEAWFPQDLPVQASSLYFRMETLDFFDGTGWRRSPSQVRAYSPGAPIGDRAHRYLGTTIDVEHGVLVHRLIGQLVPTAGIPTVVGSTEDSIFEPLLISHFRDGSVTYSPGLSNGLMYMARTEYPNLAVDMAALATGPDGQLSPLFAAAAEAGLFPASPGAVPANPTRPSDLADYLALPPNTPPSLGAIARIRTAGATTDFEKAWMLQHWFRDSGDFTYSLNVTTGSQALNLVDWLTIPSSLNYRTGYCEQFAASMAILARTLGIPSRVVWGFAPGTPTGSNQVEVRDTNAHAWVELWMDGFGWVMFDPTPRAEFLPPSPTAAFNPADFRPVDNPTVEQPGLPELPLPDLIDEEPIPLDPGSAVNEPRSFPLVPLVVLVTGLGLILIRLAKRARRERRLQRLSEGDVTAAWEEIVDRLLDMGEALDPSLTAIELAGATVPELTPLAKTYSAAVYGGKTGLGRPSDLSEAEEWIDLSYDRGRLIRGSLNPRSLLARNGRRDG